MKALNLSLLDANAWRPMESGENRSSNRVSERELSKIPAWISLPGKLSGEDPKEFPVKLWDFSSFGFALVHEHTDANTISINHADLVKLQLDFGEGKLSAQCFVENTSFFRNGLKIGLSRTDLVRSLIDKAHPKAPHGEYLRIPQNLFIHAETSNPILYGEFSQLRLCGIRPGMQFDFQTSDPALPLFIGLKMDIHLSLPNSGVNIYRGEILSLEKRKAGTLLLRLNPISLSSGLAEEMAELLASETKIAPDTLKRLGFPVGRFGNRLNFRCVESREEYRDVLQLRNEVFVEAGQSDTGTISEGKPADWEKYDRILCAYHEEELVASVEMTFPESQAAILHSESAFSGSKFTASNFRKTEILEIKNICMHKNYRSRSLLNALLDQITRIFALSDRRYILNLSDTKLSPVFRDFGFRDMEEKCEFMGKDHRLLLIDRNGILKGEGLGIIAWCNIYGALVDDLMNNGLLDFTLWELLMIKAKLSFRPVAKYLRFQKEIPVL